MTQRLSTTEIRQSLNDVIKQATKTELLLAKRLLDFVYNLLL
jgi:hypothetical protein